MQFRRIKCDAGKKTKGEREGGSGNKEEQASTEKGDINISLPSSLDGRSVVFIGLNDKIVSCCQLQNSPSMAKDYLFTAIKQSMLHLLHYCCRFGVVIRLKFHHFNI